MKGTSFYNLNINEVVTDGIIVLINIKPITGGENEEKQILLVILQEHECSHIKSLLRKRFQL